MLTQIDEDVSSLVEKIGFDKKWLGDCLQRQEQTKVVLASSTWLMGVHMSFEIFCGLRQCFLVDWFKPMMYKWGGVGLMINCAGNGDLLPNTGQSAIPQPR